MVVHNSRHVEDIGEVLEVLKVVGGFHIILFGLSSIEEDLICPGIAQLSFGPCPMIFHPILSLLETFYIELMVICVLIGPSICGPAFTDSSGIAIIMVWEASDGLQRLP
ncbi:hypothetical protein FB451DRAFT_1171837 [Mycena latifolia]|nr:hypothetical protein FB451DRAFT_1171837 [Mycena latifolia]